jgi:hypothetical protein
MSDRVRPSPWLSLAWEPSPDGSGACLTLRAPPNRGAYRVAAHEAWLVELLDHLGATPGCWSFSELAALARARGHAEADADIEATLAGLWSLAFVHERAAELEEHALVWERRGWKLALQYLIASLGEPRVREAAVMAPLSPSEAAPLRQLPTTRERPKLDIEACLQRRRTCREFSGATLELGTLATLLADASSSAPLPEQLVMHLLVMRVTGLQPGVYRVEPNALALAQLRDGSTEQIEAQLVRTLIGQPYVIGSAVAVLLSARLDALIAARPAESTLRAYLIEIGMLAQRLLLCGHAFELDSFLSAAILEHEARALTMGDIDGSMSPIHLVAFGRSVRRCEPTGAADTTPAACTE